MQPLTTTQDKTHFLSNAHWHRVFFVFFLFSIPFSIRKVFIIFSADGTFNEYLDVSLYFSDVLFIITVLLFILYNKKIVLSISYWKTMFHVEHLLLPICIPTFFILWSGLSIYWSESFLLAFYSFIHLLEFYTLYVYILINSVSRGTNDQYGECSTWNKSKSNDVEMFHVEQTSDKDVNVPRGTFFNFVFSFIGKCSTWNIYQVIMLVFIASGFFQSLIAILQFIEQKSLGLSIFKESILSPLNPGVAKVVIGSETFVRAYGLFLHPNILGGFLAISLLMTVVYPLIFKLRMFHVKHSMNIYLYRMIILIQFIALLFTFSKTAILGFIIGLILTIFWVKKMFHVEQTSDKDVNVPRGTLSELKTYKPKNCSMWNNYSSYSSRINTLFHVKQLFIIFGITLFLVSLALINLKLFIVQPFVERLFYMKPLQGLFNEYFFEGLGIGQFVYRMQDFFSEKLLNWQLQPIHNVFLLIFSEGGVIALGLFLWFLSYVYLKNKKNVPRGTFFNLKLNKCSTWNISKSVDADVFHVEHFQESQPAGFLQGEKEAIMALLMRSILLVMLFIMLFDHYLWDIEQGQLLLWILLALAVSDKRN